jgi:hypothetical protein
LRQNIQRKSLADKFIYVAPSKLHHKHEECDAERSREYKQELLKDKKV